MAGKPVLVDIANGTLCEGFGRMVGTPGAVAAVEKNGQTPLDFFSRHVKGDWGDLNVFDQKQNEQALKHFSRIFSEYDLGDGTRIYVITEAERSATIILLPEEVLNKEHKTPSDRRLFFTLLFSRHLI